MNNLTLIEESYKKFIKNLKSLIPEGIYQIDLQLLHRFDLLHFQPTGELQDPLLTRYFHIIDAPEKVTLINDEFIVWIVPEKEENNLPITSVLIALNKGEKEPQLELAFVASGAYNSTELIIKVLDKFLTEIQETERALELLRNH